jgi:adenylate kinase family enzyme
MKRILIIGSGGAGKSTLARRLGEITGIEVFHLDKLYWQPNWIEPIKDDWKKTLEEILKRDSWIMDGNFGGTMEMRLHACDTAIFLDFPPAVCLYRILKRRLKYRNTNRPDMSVGCNEKVDFKFLGWIWNYRKINKPKVKAFLDKTKPAQILHFTTAAEVEKFIVNLRKNSIKS